MKLDAEWNALEERLARTEPGYADLFVTPLLYVVSRDADADGALSEGLDMSAMLPDLLALGTLDLNQGRALPAEEAHGARPAEGEGDPGTERAYLSNVAVAPGARRRGVARALVDAARERARDAGVRHLYVHAAVDNPAAQALYLACGFEVEHEEPGAYAESLGRPARWLLHQEL